jgi:hypothetical protein
MEAELDLSATRRQQILAIAAHLNRASRVIDDAHSAPGGKLMGRVILGNDV